MKSNPQSAAVRLISVPLVLLVLGFACAGQTSAPPTRASSQGFEKVSIQDSPIIRGTWGDGDTQVGWDPNEQAILQAFAVHSENQDVFLIDSYNKRIKRFDAISGSFEKSFPLPSELMADLAIVPKSLELALIEQSEQIKRILLFTEDGELEREVDYAPYAKAVDRQFNIGDPHIADLGLFVPQPEPLPEAGIFLDWPARIPDLHQLFVGSDLLDPDASAKRWVPGNPVGKATYFRASIHGLALVKGNGGQIRSAQLPVEQGWLRGEVLSGISKDFAILIMDVYRNEGGETVEKKYAVFGYTKDLKPAFTFDLPVQLVQGHRRLFWIEGATNTIWQLRSTYDGFTFYRITW